MDLRRRPAADGASWRNTAYPTGGDVVDPVFNRVCLVLSVCPLSAMAARIAVGESLAMPVRLDPQHLNTFYLHKTQLVLLSNFTLTTLTVPMKALRVAAGMLGRSRRRPQH